MPPFAVIAVRLGFSAVDWPGRVLPAVPSIMTFRGSAADPMPPFPVTFRMTLTPSTAGVATPAAPEAS